MLYYYNEYNVPLVLDILAEHLNQYYKNTFENIDSQLIFKRDD